MTLPRDWQPSHRRSEETGAILDRAFDDAGQPVPVVAPEVYAESPFEPRQLLAARICLGLEAGRTMSQCADEAGCSVQTLSRMVSQYAESIRAGLPGRRIRQKIN
jgi:hypothetical protein